MRDHFEMIKLRTLVYDQLGRRDVDRLTDAQVLKLAAQLQQRSSPHMSSMSGDINPDRYLKVLTDLIDSGRRLDNQIIIELEDGTTLIFRRDVGDKAHPIGKRYSEPVDHYNIEVQAPKSGGRRGKKTVYNMHVIIDKDLNVIDRF